MTAQIMTKNMQATKKFLDTIPVHVATRMLMELDGKRAFTYKEVTDEYNFSIREGESMQAFSGDGEEHSAYISMGTQDSADAKFVRDAKWLNASRTFPAGTWVVSRGDWYVQHRVTLYKVVAKPLPPPEPIYETVEVEGMNWTRRIDGHADDYSRNWRTKTPVMTVHIDRRTRQIEVDSYTQAGGLSLTSVEHHAHAVLETLQRIRSAYNTIVALYGIGLASEE